MVSATRPTERQAPSCDAARVAALVQQGHEAIRKGQFDTAERVFGEALQLAPGEPDATAGRELAQAYRRGEGEPANLVSRYQAVRGLRWQRTERVCREQLERARDRMLEYRYDEAGQELQLGRQALEAGKADADSPDACEMLRREFGSLEQQWNDERIRYEADRVAGQVRAVRQESIDRRRREQEDRDRRIGQIMEQVVRFRRERNYGAAIVQIDRILATEPDCLRARDMKRDLEDLQAMAQADADRTRLLRADRTALAEAGTAAIPNTRTVEYAKGWPEKATARRRTEAGAEVAAVAVRTSDGAERRLRTAIVGPVDFAARPLRDVLDYFRTQGGVTIVPNWKALEPAAVTPDTEVTLSLSRLPLETALQILVQDIGDPSAGTRVGFEAIHGVVRISTQDDLNRTATVLGVYDISDVVVRETNQAPMGMMGMMPGMGMGGMGMMGPGGYGGYGGGYSGYGGPGNYGGYGSSAGGYLGRW